MIAWHLIFAAGAVTGAAVTAASAAMRWAALPGAAAGVGAFLLIVGWRAVANAGQLNDDFLPLISIGDCGCLLAGAIAPAALSAGVRGSAACRLLPVVVGGMVGFGINVVIL